MAKRKASEDEELLPVPEPAPDMSIEMPGADLAGSAPLERDAELIDGQFQAGTWQDKPMLTCTLCRWDTLDGLDAARAYKARCPRCSPPPEPPKPVLVQAYDRFGNPID